MFRQILTYLNFLFATFPAPSGGTDQPELSDEQALAIARQAIDDLRARHIDSLLARFEVGLKGLISGDQLKSVWSSLLTTQGDYQGETANQIVRAQGMTIAVLTLGFSNGALNATIPITAKGQIGGLNFGPAPSTAPAALDLAPDEQEISFQVGNDTMYGTLLIPAGVQGRIPAVLMLSGSGPTDRDGNSRMLPGTIDSHKWFARILADAGIASLRYDKIGTGKTGMATHQTPGDLTFDLYVDAALTGYRYLADRPEIDTIRMAFLGHSEGTLIAVVAADRLKAAPPRALMLFAPVSKPFMQTLRDQTADHYASAVQAGAVTRQQADEALAELDRLIAQVKQDATVPAEMSSQWKVIFTPHNLKFLQNVSQYDPAQLAEALPPSIKVLVLCGQKDEQVSCADAQRLVDGFRRGGNTGLQFIELPNVNHVLKEIEGATNLQTDYTDPSKPFSREAAARITEFVKTAL